MHKGIDCPNSILGHLNPDWKGQVSKQSTEVVGETALMQTCWNTFWQSVHCGGSFCFEAANLPPHSKNLEGIL